MNITLSIAPEAPTPLPSRPVMEDAQFNQFLQLVRRHSFDDEKVEAIMLLRGSKVDLTADQVNILLDQLSFDNGKIGALAAIADHIDCPAMVSLDTFSFSSTKDAAQRVLMKWINH